ncbi:MAG: PAS domain-containing protein [Chloroflexi bacterium]|nr:PAS domain-containing protein [Chloroflexota bacterium]
MNLLNQLPDVMIITDTDGTIVEWNQRAEELFLQSRHAVIGLSLTQNILTSPTAHKWWKHLQHTLSEVHYWEGEFPFDRLDHKQLWLFIRAKSIMLDDNRPAIMLIGTQLQGHEIRERAVWTALDFSHHELHNILSSVGDMVCKYNLFQKAMVFVSPSCLKLTGYTEYEFIDNPALFLNIIHAEDRQEMENALSDMRPNEVINLDYRISHKEGHTYWVRNSMTPILDNEDTVVDVICAITDITPYYELSDLKSQLIRMASHDLKHPLAIAMGYFGVLLEDINPMLDEAQHSMTQWITESHELMNGMLTELADLEQVGMKGVHATEKIEWLALVDKVLEQSALQLENHQHQISIGRPATAFTVRGEAIRLHQVLFNLVSNAIKYTPDGGKIEVRVFVENQRVYTEVQDNGAGVPEDFRAKLFKPFSRAKSPETAHIPGTGLGLSLVKSIIEQHDGEVIYRPETKGSTFGFWLPIIEA